MYQVEGSNAAIGTTKSPLAITGGTGVVVCLTCYELMCEGAPTSEAAIAVFLRRQTAVGTGTSVTPTVNSPGSRPAAEAAALSELTAEPTYASGRVKAISWNPRSRALWNAVDQDAFILTPLTANNGLGFQCSVVGGGSGILRANAEWKE